MSNEIITRLILVLIFAIALIISIMKLVRLTKKGKAIEKDS